MSLKESSRKWEEVECGVKNLGFSGEGGDFMQEGRMRKVLAHRFILCLLTSIAGFRKGIGSTVFARTAFFSLLPVLTPDFLHLTLN
jgi:hypothetical protein